jgi:copper chaperone
MTTTVFSVPDMSCAHCAKAINSAIAAVDPQALVDIDVTVQRVRVNAAEASEADLAEALREAGYTPVVLREVTSHGAR